MNPVKWQVLNPVEDLELLFEQGLDLEWAWEAAPVLASWQCLKL